MFNKGLSIKVWADRTGEVSPPEAWRKARRKWSPEPSKTSPVWRRLCVSSCGMNTNNPNFPQLILFHSFSKVFFDLLQKTILRTTQMLADFINIWILNEVTWIQKPSVYFPSFPMRNSVSFHPSKFLLILMVGRIMVS